jgi:methylated-DNA-protein-cysteine methyltransferase-like protein
MKVKKSKKQTPFKPVAVSPSGKRDQSFFQLVHEIVKQIPRGRVTSYGAIAGCLGTKLSARMVGWALQHAHHPSQRIPAHRVVNRNGMLSGKHHFGNEHEMQRLLEKENIKVVNDQVQNFNKVFWDPREI